jgi:hypothetical protein
MLAREGNLCRGCETVGEELGAEDGEKGIKTAGNDKNDRFWA